MISLTIIIVNWKVRKDLYECLTSIYDSDLSEMPEVIVVDNASHDGSVEMIRGNFPNVKLIINHHNVGFPKANNQALAVAQGEFVLYLNPDTLVNPDTLSTCVKFLRENKDVGLMGCKILYPDGSIQYECARNFPSLITMVWETFYLHMLFPGNRYFGRTLMGYWDHQDSRDVPCLSGAFMLGRRSILQKLGGMDESEFMYLEDTDLCYRVRKEGWRISYLANVSITHKSGRSPKKHSGPLIYGPAQIPYAFFKKHFGTNKAIIYRLLLLMRAVFRLTVSLALLPVTCLFPRIKSKLRTISAPSLHWNMIKWFFGYTSLTK